MFQAFPIDEKSTGTKGVKPSHAGASDEMPHVHFL
jgi:hypothetical protein